MVAARKAALRDAGTSSAAISTGPGRAQRIIAAIDASEMLTPTAPFDEAGVCLAAGIAWGSRSPTPKAAPAPTFPHLIPTLSKMCSVGRSAAYGVATPQLMRYKLGVQAFADTIIGVCDIWPVCGEDDRTAADGGITAAWRHRWHIGSDASCAHCRRSLFSSSQQDYGESRESGSRISRTASGCQAGR